MTDSSQPGYIPPPTRRDWIAILSAILGAFMAILDIQIINSSLKDIQGALSATIEEGSWISTSYLVAEIIVIPLAAWLAMVLSPRRFAVSISILFVLASLLCSMAIFISAKAGWKPSSGRVLASAHAWNDCS